MGLVNTVVPLARLEEETVQWAAGDPGEEPAWRSASSRRPSTPTPTAWPGIQELAGDATLLYYMTEEAQEGRNAYVEKRKPDFSKFPRFP